MAIVNGAAPSGTVMAFSGWGGYTFVDRSVAIPSGIQVTHLGVHAPAGGSHRLRLCKASGSGFDFPAGARVDLPHTAAGYQDAALPVPFTVPAGTWYMACSVLSGSTTRSVEGAAGATTTWPPAIVGDGVHNGWTPIGAVPPMRATHDGEPAPGSKRVVAGLGQSNCVRLFSEGGAVMEGAFSVPGQTLRLVSTAVNSSSLAMWLPGSAFLNAAIAAYNAAMQEADTEHGAFIWYRGENESSVQADAAALPELWAASIAAFRAGVGQDIPVIIPVLFAKPTDSRPYWASVQGSQLAMTTADLTARIAGAHSVSLADLVGTLDDGVHLDPATNATAGQRVGQALSTIL